MVFKFKGPSLQAVLDKVPSIREADVIDRGNNEYTIEADVYGDGIKMFLLSQGSWVKVLESESFVREMQDEIHEMAKQYSPVD